MDAKELKKYLSQDTDRVIKALEYFDFHDFSVHMSDEERVSCALPDGDNETSVNIYMNEYLNGIVFSRGNFKGDIFSIIEEFTNYSFKQIVNNISGIFGLGGSSEKTIDYADYVLNIGNFKHYANINRRKKHKEGTNKLYDESVLDNYTPYYVKELIEEGISPKVAKHFNVITDTKQERMLFPHYDWIEHDKIVGIQARKIGMDSYTLKQLGILKYYNYIKDYKKEYNLYGWSHNHENIKEANMMIIFEGEKSVLKESTFNYCKGIGVAVGGSNISETQVAFIINNTSTDTEIVIAFDNDLMTDEEKFNQLYENIKYLTLFRKVTYVKDFTNKLLDEKDSPVDKGRKIWRGLLSMRKKFEK